MEKKLAEFVGPDAARPKWANPEFYVSCLALLVTLGGFAVSLNANNLAADANAMSIEANRLALEANEPYELSATFNADLQACGVVQADNTTVAVESVTQATVVTNTGRLPVTIVAFWDGERDGDEFSWRRLGGSEGGTNTPFHLDVGEAVVVRTTSPGRELQVPFRAQTADAAEISIEFPEQDDKAELKTVEAALEEMPEYCGSGQSKV